jgi:hypothetical protein
MSILRRAIRYCRPVTPKSAKPQSARPHKGGRVARGRGGSALIPGDHTMVRVRAVDQYGDRRADVEMPVPEHPGFFAWAEVLYRRRVPEIVSVTVRKAWPTDSSTEDRGPVTTRMLRCVPLGVMLSDAQNALRSAIGANEVPAAMVTPFLEPTSRPGRRGHPDVYYAQIAAEYARLQAQGSRSPTRDLADRMHISYSTARDAIGTARRRGLLTSAPRSSSGSRRGGRAGGELTKEALEVLRSSDES